MHDGDVDKFSFHKIHYYNIPEKEQANKPTLMFKIQPHSLTRIENLGNQFQIEISALKKGTITKIRNISFKLKK